MIRISDKVKCMASLATFRKMVKDRQSIYDVIGQLAGQIIIEKAIQYIDYASLRNLMKQEAGIDVPISIVKTSMKHIDFVDTDSTQVIVNEKLTKELENETKELLDANKKRDQEVYNSLVNFVEGKTHESLSNDEKTQLIKDFCAYMVNDAYNVKYADYISNFFLTKETDPFFMEQMSQIREGLLIFLGLAYNVNDAQIDVVDTPLSLYLDTEILFHMAGFNGELFKNLFDEFYDQVAAINKKARKPLVKLMYFEETSKEIDFYFGKALDIVNRKTRLDFSKTAMRSIVKGCKETYDILQKKAEFKQLLKSKEITLDSQRNFYDRDNIQFNATDLDMLNGLANDEIDENKISEKLCLLNYIFIKRGHKAHQYFRNVGHILISGNTLTFEIAKRMDHQPTDVPLVWGMDHLTNRFWLMLNKGIIPSTQLKSFDVLSKARIVLSNKINSSVERLFKEIDRDIESGKLTSEKAKVGIVELRKYSVTPDNISAENADNYMTIFSEDSIEQLIAESEARQRKAQEFIDKQADLIKEQESSLDNIKGKNKLAIIKLTDKTNDEIKRQYEADIKVYENEKSACVEKQFRICALKKYSLGIGFLLFIATLFVLNHLFSKSKEWIGYIVTFILFIFPFFRPIINHIPIKNAFSFICCKDEKDRIKRLLADEYEQRYERPKLKLKTYEDIEREM